MLKRNFDYLVDESVTNFQQGQNTFEKSYGGPEKKHKSIISMLITFEFLFLHTHIQRIRFHE